MSRGWIGVVVVVVVGMMELVEEGSARFRECSVGIVGVVGGRSRGIGAVVGGWAIGEEVRMPASGVVVVQPLGIGVRAGRLRTESRASAEALGRMIGDM